MIPPSLLIQLSSAVLFYRNLLIYESMHEYFSVFGIPM